MSLTKALAYATVNAALSRTGVAFFSEVRVFSWEKAHRELGYTAEHDLATGLSITVAWYRQHGWL